MFINLIARKGGDCMELIKMRGIVGGQNSWELGGVEMEFLRII